MQVPTKGPHDGVPAGPQAAKPPRREQDLIVIPEAKQLRRWGVIAAVVAGVVALILIVALSAYAIDQRDRADDLDAQLTQAVSNQQALVDAATASRERVAALETRVGSLEGALQGARQGKDSVEASREAIRSDLLQAQEKLEAGREAIRSDLLQAQSKSSRPVAKRFGATCYRPGKRSRTS